MGVEEGNLQIIDVDMTLENCSVTNVIELYFISVRCNTVQYQSKSASLRIVVMCSSLLSCIKKNLSRS